MIVILHLQSNFCILFCHEILSSSICPLTYVCISLGSDHKHSCVESKIHKLLSKERGGLGRKEEGKKGGRKGEKLGWGERMELEEL